MLFYCSAFTFSSLSFFFNDTATTEIYTLSLHDALPIYSALAILLGRAPSVSCEIKRMLFRIRNCRSGNNDPCRSEEHTSELQSLRHLVCRLLLEKKKKKYKKKTIHNKYQINTLTNVQRY